MSSVDPRQVFRQVVCRKFAAIVPRVEILNVVHTAKFQAGTCTAPREVETLTCEPPAEVVDKLLADDPGVANRRALAVGEQNSTSRLAGELHWLFVFFEIGELTTDEDVVLVIRAGVINPPNISRFVFLKRSIVTKPDEIQAP